MTLEELCKRLEELTRECDRIALEIVQRRPMCRPFELTHDEMKQILDTGIRCGYFEFKDKCEGEGIRMLRLEIESAIQDREFKRKHELWKA